MPLGKRRRLFVYCERRLSLPPHGRRPVRGGPGFDLVDEDLTAGTRTRKKPFECVLSVNTISEYAISIAA
jgi:hypothetical protein